LWSRTRRDFSIRRSETGTENDGGAADGKNDIATLTVAVAEQEKSAAATEAAVPSLASSSGSSSATNGIPAIVPSYSLSLASLSSSVRLQSKRIIQLEADALRKHQEAERAAASAREALERMDGPGSL